MTARSDRWATVEDRLRRAPPAARRRLAAALGRGPSAINVTVHELGGLVVAPHITLVNPFAPANRIDDALVAELRTIAARLGPLEFTLERTGRFPGILYLSPEPAAPFVAIVEAIVARWPQWPPYGGEFDTVIPHLTVAHGAGELAIPPELAAALPVRARSEAIELMAMGRDGRWSERATLPLGG